MSHHLRLVSLRVHPCLTVLILALPFTAPSARGNIQVRFDNLGTVTVPSLQIGNLLVTGSNDVHMLNFNGLGILGGFSDTRVDVHGNEFVTFTFDPGPVENVTYTLAAAGNFPGGVPPGERILEAFAPGGASLGTVMQHTFDSEVSSLFGHQPIESFTLTPINTDHFRVYSVQYGIPEPGMLTAAGLPVLWAALRRRRPVRNDSGTPSARR